MRRTGQSVRTLMPSGWRPSNSERLRAAQAIRTGRKFAFCRSCSKDKHLHKHQDPGRCNACNHATARLLEVIRWIQEEQKLP